MGIPVAACRQAADSVDRRPPEALAASATGAFGSLGGFRYRSIRKPWRLPLPEPSEALAASATATPATSPAGYNGDRDAATDVDRLTHQPFAAPHLLNARSMTQPQTPADSRRTFLRRSTAAAATTAVAGMIVPAVHAAADDVIRIAFVGMGGRGSGAADNLLNTKGNIQIVAVADPFVDKAKSNVKRLVRKHGEKANCPDDKIFGGLDGYKKAIDTECDLVVIATPPGFKPMQFEYAIAKNRHVFMEKPVAVDAPGCRRVMESVLKSREQNRMVGIGLQRRHEPQYMETIARIHDGAIGDVLAQQVYWNGQGIWYRNPTDDMTDMQFQVNNWYHFNWICGDQICEQHIHNLDVGCWVKQEYPVRCNGMGGHEQRMDGTGEMSQIFDHTFCEYTFKDGSKMHSQGRHLKGGWSPVQEFAIGTKGTSDPSGQIMGQNAWTFEGERKNGHQQEQHDLIEALMRGDIYNEGEYGVKSTFTAILGREAAYSAQVIEWDELWEKGRELAPGIDQFTLESTPPVVKGPDGRYPIPVPGQYNPFV